MFAWLICVNGCAQFVFVLFQKMNNSLMSAVRQAGVKDNVIEILEEEEVRNKIVSKIQLSF